MKRIALIISGVLLCSVLTVNAKKLPAVAAKLPSSLKQEIVDEIDYPSFAKDAMIEGEVWMKVCVSEDSKIRIVDMSATDQQLGAYVKSKLTDLLVDKSNCVIDQVFYLKVDFNLLNCRN